MLRNGKVLWWDWRVVRKSWEYRRLVMVLPGKWYFYPRFLYRCCPKYGRGFYFELRISDCKKKIAFVINNK